MNVRLVVIAAATALTLASVGCSSADDDGDEASTTATAALQTQSQDGVLDAVIDTEGDAAPEPEAAAQRVVDYVSPGLSPADCAKKTRDGNVVTLTLDACTGPFGRAVVAGRLVATFSKTSSNDLRVDIVASDDTTANGRSLSYAAQADVRFEGAKRVIAYRGHSNGSTKRGKDFARQTELSIVADVTTRCATIDGSSKGSIGRYDVDLTIAGFEACRDVCPTAGVARANVSGPLSRDVSVEVTFDGSDTAHATISARKMRKVDVALDCQTNEAAE